jgi:aryl-alcohol dehydrogenase-like predicted oxidoreductase
MSPKNDVPRDDAESIATVRRAADAGVTLFDTSDAYGNGHNEELLAEALKGRMDRVVVASKFGNMRGPTGAVAGTNGKPDYVPLACEASLKRLGVERIELYYLHRVDPEVPIEETVGAMGKLVEQGKVRCIGLSEAKPDEIRRAHAVHPITSLQSEYSLWTRDAELEVLPICEELGITYVGYAPLGRGFLTASIKKPEDMHANDRRWEHPRFQDENFKKNIELLKVLEALAAEKKCSPANVALAWAMSRDGGIVPIPGSRRRPHLEENLRAIDVTLSPDDLAELEAAFPVGKAAGTRYPEKQLHLMGF